MGFRTPLQTIDALEAAGITKSKLSIDVILILGIIAGVWLSFGGYLSVVVGFNPGLAANGLYGLQRFVPAALFPVGLMLILWTGAELYTGNTMVLTFGLLNGKINIFALLINWTLSLVGNQLGSLAIAYIFFYAPQQWQWLPGASAADPTAEAFRTYVANIAIVKTSRNVGYVFLLAMAANFLVAAAVYSNAAADDIISKFVGIWFPIALFIAVGLEHSIANMFSVPLGIMYARDGGLIWKYIVWNITVIAGNTVSGMGFAAYLWYCFVFRPKYRLRPKMKALISRLRGQKPEPDILDQQTLGYKPESETQVHSAKELPDRGATHVIDFNEKAVRMDKDTVYVINRSPTPTEAQVPPRPPPESE